MWIAFFVGCSAPSGPSQELSISESKQTFQVDDFQIDHFSFKNPSSTRIIHPPLLQKTQDQCQRIHRWVQKKSDQGLRWERLTQCYLQQARIDGTWDSWKLAANALEKAFQVSSKSKPWATRVRLSLSLHRTQGVENDLKNLEKGAILLSSKRKEIKHLKREYQRLLKGSLHLCSYFKSHHPYTLSDWIRKAECRKEDDLKEGITLLDTIPTSFLHSPLSLAWFHLIRGRWQSEWTSSQEGEIDFKKVDQSMPNWFEVEAARAENIEADGYFQEALELYLKLAHKTQRGMWYEKAFNLAIHLNDKEKANLLQKQTYDRYSQLYQWAPEVAFDHGIVFMIRAYPQDAQRWIDFIKQHRPFPQDRLIWASALLSYQQGHVKKAKSTIERLLTKEVPNTHLASEDLAYVASFILSISSPKKASLLKRSALLRSPKIIQKWNWLSPH